VSLRGIGLAALGASSRGGRSSYVDALDAISASYEDKPTPYRGTAPVTGFLELISRPGWAARAALSGDLQAAGKHIVQMAADIPFGGWIDKELSLTRLLPDEWKYAGSYDITSEGEKYEASDMLDAWGVDTAKKGSWARFGVDIGLGIFTDPLSLVSGPAGGIGRKALTGAVSSRGRTVLKGALEKGMTGRSPLLRTGSAANLDDALIEAIVKGNNYDASMATALKKEAAVSRKAGEKALEKVEQGKVKFGYRAAPFGIPGTDPKRRFKGEFFWEQRPEHEMLNAVDWLRANGHIDSPGGLMIGLPFKEPWFNLFGQKRVDAYLRSVQSLKGAYEGASKLWGWSTSAVGSLWDRTLGMAHLVPAGAGDEARYLQGQNRMLDSFARDDVALAYTIDDELKALRGPNHWDELNDTQKETLNFFDDMSLVLGKDAEKKLNTSFREALATGRYGPTLSDNFKAVMAPYLVQHAGLSHKDAIRRAAKLKKKMFQSLKKGDDFKVPSQYLGNIPGDIVFKLPQYLTEQHLRARFGNRYDQMTHFRGINKYIETHFPSQMHARNLYRKSEDPLNWPQSSWDRFADDFKKANEEEVRQSLAGQVPDDLLDDAVKNQLDQMAPTRQSVTEQIANFDYRQYHDFLRSARDNVLDTVTDSRLSRKVSQIAPNQGGELRLTIPEIAHRRLVNDNRARAAREANIYTQQIALLNPEIDADVLTKYFQDSLGEVVFTPSAIGKILVGGEIPLRNAGYDAAAKFEPNEMFLKQAAKGEISPIIARRTSTGEIERSWRYPGFNRFFKPALTSMNPAFHVGNNAGSILMGAMDPDVGWTGVGAMLHMGGQVVGIDSAQAWKSYTKALHTDPKKSIIGMHEVSQLSGTVGDTGLTHVEFIELARTMLGGGWSNDASDLMSHAGDFMSLMSLKEVGGVARIPKEVFEAWRAFGENVGNFSENHFRLNALIKKLEAGKAKDAAVNEVRNIYVNYEKQGKVEQWLRTYFPFIRFRIGGVAWTRAVLTRPRVLMPVASSQRATGDMTDPRDPDQLPAVWDKLDVTLPGGWRVPTRAGAESTLETLGGFKGMGARRLMGELHPIGSFMLEQAIDKSLWSGKKFASDTTAKGIERLFGEEKVSRWGDKRAVIDGLYKEIIHTTPVSRLLRTAGDIYESAVADEPGSFGRGILKTLTGIKKRKIEEDEKLKYRMKTIIAQLLESGDIYTFEKALSATTEEETPLLVRNAISDYASALKQIRERRKLDAASRGQ